MKQVVLLVAFMLVACGAGPVATSNADEPVPEGTATTAQTEPTSPVSSASTVPPSETASTVASNGGASETTTTTTGLQPRPSTTRPPESNLFEVPEWFSDQGPLPISLSAAIKAKLVADTGVPADQVIESGAMYVTWRNSSLGCPSPGEMSLQVLTDGFLAYFDVDGSLYRVHTDLDSAFRICNLPAPPDVLPVM